MCNHKVALLCWLIAVSISISALVSCADATDPETPTNDPVESGDDAFFVDFEDARSASHVFSLDVFPPPYADDDDLVGIFQREGSYVAGRWVQARCSGTPSGKALVIRSAPQFDLSTCAAGRLEYDYLYRNDGPAHSWGSIEYTGMGRATAVDAQWELSFDSDDSSSRDGHVTIPLDWDCGSLEPGEFEITVTLGDMYDRGCEEQTHEALLAIDNLRVVIE